MQTIKWAANQRIEAVYNGNTVEFYVRESGDKATLAGSVHMDNLHPDVGAYAKREGIKKRVNDACASAENNVQRFATIEKLTKHYDGGAATWRVESAGVIAKRLDRAAMYQAIATVRGMEVTVVEQKLRDKADDFLRSYNAIKEIAAEYARLTAKASVEVVDEDALFGALES